MALSVEQFIETVKRQLTGRMPASFQLEAADREIYLASDIARHRLANEVARDTNRRHLLQQSYSITTTADSAGDMCGALLTATGSITSAADILPDSVPLGSVVDSQGNSYSYIPQWASFRYGTYPAVFGYYTLRAQKLYVRSVTNGSFTDDVSPLSVTANFVPTITNLPDNLANDLTQITAELVLSNAQSPKD